MAAVRRSTRIGAKSEDTSVTSVPSSTVVKQQKRKAPVSTSLPAPSAQPEAPTTPRKRQRTSTVAPPLTPTPSAVNLIAPSKSASSKKPLSAAVNRLADPQRSNATLLSPESSRIVASRNVQDLSPSKPARPTTATLLQEACDHLIKVDERMRPLIENNYCHAFSPEGLAEKIDPFESLVSGIISQQVSGAAAKSIKAKFIGLFELEESRRFPTPSEVHSQPLEYLRTAGLSQRKAEYIKGLSEKFVDGELTAQFLHDAPYEQVLEKLIAVRGLGKWSVEMFACFALKRTDVFSLGDLGIQRGMAAFVGRDVSKLKAKGGGKFKYMSEQDMIELSDKFAPYRSLFMWYMWRVEETDISTME